MSLKSQIIANAARLGITVPQNPTLGDLGKAMQEGQEAMFHGLKFAPPISPISPVIVRQAPTGLASGTIEGAVEHILDELAYHGYSPEDLCLIAVAIAEAALPKVSS